MQSNEELLDALMERVSERMVVDLRTALAETVEREINRNISRALLESEFFRRINIDLQEGLKSIYHEISSVKKEHTPSDNAPAQADELLSEATDQLDKILQTTEKATVEIMEIVEKHLDKQEAARQVLARIREGKGDPGEVDQLLSLNEELNNDLITVMTSLSFQDLTGQRIKRIIAALKEIERITFDLFMTAGIKIKAQEQNPDKDLFQLDREAREKVSLLKGPQLQSKQGDVDDLLSQLGLD